jgi:hypothetical protein
VAGEEAEWVKMFDPRPVGFSPPLPERLMPTNPVPEVMEAQGLYNLGTPHTWETDLLNGLDIATWDGRKRLHFMTIRGTRLESPFNSGVWPGPTIRIPRGVIFHAFTRGKGPPPHTIHWHGLEPTPMNDGVGHCSMEIGGYTYQFQPNFIGSYFYHCHRNTVQHFEFGLYGDLHVLPPDAYFASVEGADWRTQSLPANIVLNNIPVGACSDGKFRCAANVANFPQFPGFVGGDPTLGVAGAGDVGVGDPHAFTVPYDVEAMWVIDDRDSRWSDLASNAFATFPEHGNEPGVDDRFDREHRAGKRGFFAFNDYHADYFFNTGLPFLGHRDDRVPADMADPTPAFGGLTIPAALNSGVSGTQVAVNAQVGQTILVRCLDACYASILVTFPVDVVVIAWDGRALGVPPFGLYNHAYVVPAGTPIRQSTARRFDALIRPTQAMRSFVNVEMQDTRGDRTIFRGRIPFNIA